MNLGKSRRRSDSELISNEGNIEKKLTQIDEAISSYMEKKYTSDDLIEEKLNKVLDMKLKEHKYKVSLDTYKKENEYFVNSIKDKIRKQYYEFIDDQIRILRKSKEHFIIFKQL